MAAIHGPSDPWSRKVDARLGHVLRMPRERLVDLVRAEEARLVARVRALARDPASADKPSFDAAPITAGIYLRPDGPVASVFVASDASADDLRSLGAEVRSKAGDIFTATVPLDALAGLLASRAVLFVELARPLFPSDHAVPESGIASLQAAMPPVTGAGVVVGVLDTALDFHHPAFRDAGNATRIGYLWDQRLVPIAGEAGPPPSLLPLGGTTYGVEYARATIDAALAQFGAATAGPYEVVRHHPGAGEHGTHVAGIIAGNGRGTPAGHAAYVGAAPGADIVFVAYPSLFNTAVLADSTYLADGLAYVFARAAALGKPAVVNVSVSDDQGAHDGTTHGERFIDTLLAVPGRAVTLSAGNANKLGAHAAGMVTAGTPVDLAIAYEAGAVNSDAMEIWYGGQDRFRVTITVPTTPATSIGPIDPGSGAFATVTLPGSGVTVDVTSTVDDPRNHDNSIVVIVTVPLGQEVPKGTWTFRLEGTAVTKGHFDAWVDRNNRTLTSPEWQAPHRQEDALTLGVPATCRNAIVVGNYDRLHPNKPQDNSGCGPTRDGRVKPDLATFGTGVVAPWSRDMSVNTASAAYDKKTGTSQSAPLVGGACALMFECRGATATCHDLLQVLTATADASFIAVPDAAFGYGRLQVAAACATPLPPVDVWMRDDATDTGREPFTGAVGWLSPDIELLDTAGNPVTHPTHDATQPYGNLVRVHVRNRGTQPAQATDVYLYWADPSTSIAYPADWNATGIFTGGPAFTTAGNVLTIASIPSGGAASVQFAWAPPAVGGNLAGDAHFCLIARVENASDPSTIGAGGWASIGASNNLALHNLDVIDASAGGDSISEFRMTGGDGEDALDIVSSFDRAWVLELPAAVLPWRDLATIEQLGPRPLFRGHGGDWIARLTIRLQGIAVQSLTDIEGAIALELAEGTARVHVAAAAHVVVPILRLAPGARATTRVRVAPGTAGVVHVGQLRGGRRIGGVSVAADPARGRRARRAPRDDSRPQAAK